MTSSNSTFEAVVAMSDLREGSYVKVEHKGRSLLVFYDKGQVHCLENLCPHMLKPLDGGRYANGRIACPIHGASFDVTSGKNLTPPAIKPACAIPARINGEHVEVGIAESS